jgi:hypothetical protein
MIYILIETRSGQTLPLASKLRQLSGVRRVIVVNGPYDILVEASSMECPTVLKDVKKACSEGECAHKVDVCLPENEARMAHQYR